MTTPAAAKPTPLWEDFVDILTSPAEVFARRERGSWIIPTIVVTVLITILFIASRTLFQPAMDAEFARQTARAMSKNPQLTMDQMQKGRHFGEMVAMIAPVFATPIAIVLGAIVLWLVGKLFDAKEDLAPVLVVAAYSFVPRVLAAIAAAVIAALSSPESLNSFTRLTLSVAKLLNADTTSPVVMGLASRVDLFIVWQTILLAIGLSVVGKIRRGPALIAAVITWLVGALPTVLPALL